MKKLITRGLGLCALVAALVAPPFGKAQPAGMTCDKVVSCSGALCCNHCDVRTTTCVTQ